MAARHVADGEMVIARQKELIEKLRSEGGNVSEALEILQAFLRSQQVFVAYHSALQRDLSEADPVLDVGIAAQ